MFTVTSLRTSKCMSLCVLRNTHRAHTWCQRHQIDPLASAPSLAPTTATAPAAAAGHVVLCSALLLLKTLCRAHYKLIIPVPSCSCFAKHTPAHTHASIWPHNWQLTGKNRERGTAAGMGMVTVTPLPYAAHSSLLKYKFCVCTANPSNVCRNRPSPVFCVPGRNMKRIIFMMRCYTLHEPNEWNLCSKIHLFEWGVAIFRFQSGSREHSDFGIVVRGGGQGGCPLLCGCGSWHKLSVHQSLPGVCVMCLGLR